MWSLFALAAFFSFGAMSSTGTLIPALASTLLGMFLYWQIAPVVTASMGASLDLQKLIIYPVDLDKLFLVEVLLRFLTVGEMLVMLTGIELGIVFNPSLGGLGVFVRLTPALVLFVLFNLLVAAGIRGLIERMFRRKGAREIAMFGFVLLCAAPSVLLSSKSLLPRLLPYLPVQANWPWGAPGQLATTARGWESLVAMAALPIWIWLAYRFGRRESTVPCVPIPS